MALKSDVGYKPPVICSADNPQERQEALAFFDHYIHINAADVAAAEDERLSYYKEALDKRFAQALPENKGGPKKPFSLIRFITPPPLRDFKPRDVYEPGDLKNIFAEITSQTRNIILSEVMILPHSFINDEDIQSRKEIHSGGVETTYLHANAADQRAYHFGFYDVRQNNKGADSQWYKYESDIALPVLALDDAMLQPVVAHKPHDMLRALQEVVTLCNHDMMHNMINVVTKGDISRLTETHYKAEMTTFMEDKTGMYGSNDALGIESGLIIGHARTWQHLQDTPAGENLQRAVTRFYDELDRIGHEVETDDTLTQDIRHQVMDYFAMAVPFALVRMLPLQDPLMDYALARAAKTDTGPQAYESEPGQETSPAEEKTLLTQQYYRKAGMPLAADERAPQSYAEAKKLQLTQMLPDITVLLAPAPKGSPAYKAHARADEMDRDITNIILRHAKSTRRPD